ncbi:MAG: TonB-dependent receptor [Deferribacterales bacterium]
MKRLIIVTLLLFSFAAYADDTPVAADEPVYNLEINKEGKRESTADKGNVITKDEMERDNAHDLWEAVRYTPGIILSGGGSRNESSFTVRGFGADSVPIFVDGVIMANPYKGEGDAARILTGDLESVTIQKGYSSMLLGANTLGGAILMKTAKPQKEFEAQLDTTIEFDSIYKRASNYYLGSIGTKQDKFYFKGTVQHRDVDHFRLSDDFEPTSVNPQGKGERLFSDSKDSKYTLVAGITPSSNLDIWATYIYQDADKGVSPPETTIAGASIWDWPVWKRRSYSLASTYHSGKFSLDTLIHYDKYDNTLHEYYNLASYNAGVHKSPSDYDEYSAGGRVTAGWTFNPENKIEFAATYKREQHNSLTKDIKDMSIKEDTYSIGTEYTYIPVKKLTIVGGIGYDALHPVSYWSKSDDFAQFVGSEEFTVDTDSEWLIKGQLGAFYEVVDNHELRLTYARKNHFPNMSQRYSTRFGSELPNPQLQPEIADHYELGYKGDFGRIKLNTALYYSVLKDKITTIEIPDPTYPTTSVDFSLNIDEVTFYGYELSADASLNRYLSGGVAFSVNKYEIGRNADETVEVINYYPEITSSGYLVIAPFRDFTLTPRVEYIDSRYADVEGNEKLSSYVLVGLKATYDINRNFAVSVGASNILDENYEIKEYYPLAGRTFYATLSARY